MSDISFVIIWWLTIFLIGIIFLPITLKLFGKFADRGYIFTKIIGILISSYLMWLLSSLQLLPFSKLSIIVILLGATLANLWIGKNLKKENSSFKIPWAWIIFEESLFLVTLSFWSYVRGCEPSIRGLEKFMDFGFVNSILRANFFPPLDMWLTKSPDYAGGYFINYYYFGHYITAFLTKLSGIDSTITYNLAIATLFAFTFTLSFSIGMNLVYLFFSKIAKSIEKEDKYQNLTNTIKYISVGFLAAFLVSLGGNLHSLYTLTTGYPNENPEPPWKLSLGFTPERYWYPNATRFIPFTIHEFPIYSFVVADLHGHVSDIPLVLLIIGLLLTLVIPLRGSTSKEVEPPQKMSNLLKQFEDHTSIPFFKIMFLGLLVAVMYMTNAWDGLIYMVLSGFVFLSLNLNRQENGQRVSFLTTLYKTFSASLFLLFFFLIFSFPFSLRFKPFVSGIGVLCAPSFLLDKKIGPFLFETGKCQKSPFYQLAILWGFFYFNVFAYLILTIIPYLFKRWKGMHHNTQNDTERIKNKKFLARPSGKAKSKKDSSLLHLSFFTHITPIDIFVLLLILVSTLLLVFPEFFYIKDIYPAHYRANTMFKLGYQAFMMLGLVSAYIFVRIKSQWDISFDKIGVGMILNIIYYILFTLLFFLVAIYPMFAINSYYGGLKVYHGLYGLNWLANQYPQDYQAVSWLRKNIPENTQPVILEANGDSYTDYDRVSANTGLPTIVGWPVHEWLWRGSYDEAGKRIPEVASVYESKDLDVTKEILRKYNVEYIFLGTLEREKYKALNEEKMEKLGKVVFEDGKTKIYKVSL